MKKFLVIFLLLIIFFAGVYLLNTLGIISVQAWGENIITSTPFLKEYVQTGDAYNQLFQQWKEREEEFKELISTKEELQQALNTADKKVTEQAKKIEALEQELAILKEKKKNEQERLDKLVKIYSRMKPEKAAEIFTSLDEETILDLLMNLKEEQAAAILAALPPKEAAKYSKKINGF